MPDGRFISKDISQDWELNSVSLEADYLFMRCIPHLDRDGRLPGLPDQVRAIAVPLRREFTPRVVDRCLGELQEAGLVKWYFADDRPCLEFTGFEQNQRGMKYDREAPSKIPPVETEGSQPLRAGVLIQSEPDPDKVLLSEVKGSEVKGSEVKRSSARENPAISELRDWLGEYSGAVDVFLDSVHGASKALHGAWATYRDGGTAEITVNEWANTPEDRRPICFAMAIEAYASDFSDFKSHLFRAVLKDKIREAKSADGPTSTSGRQALADSLYQSLEEQEQSA